MLFIDYAYSNNEIFKTLQAVKKHRKVDVLKEVGNSDITHLINIPFLKKILKKFNLKLNYNTQRDFLLKLGKISIEEFV